MSFRTNHFAFLKPIIWLIIAFFDDYIIKNATKLSNIPTSIIQGRYDFICPPINAYKLHKKIKGSKLSFVTAAHSATREKTLKKNVISELERVSSFVQPPSGR